MIGSGVYGVSASGNRFDEFPDIIADDLFVKDLFRVDERVVVEGTIFTIDAPGVAGVRSCVATCGSSLATTNTPSGSEPRTLVPEAPRRR